MDQTIREIEKKDGVRLTWNILPINKVDYTKQSIPIACLYSLHKETNLLEYEPVFCQNKGCRAIINPYAQVNFQRQDWVCCFCQQRSLLPNHYKDLEVNNLAAELMEENTTIEYLSGREISQSNVFFILLDGCFFDEERRNLALNAVLKVFNNLPDDSYVGLVTFGTNIELFDLSESVIRKTYLFSGVKTYKKENLLNFTKGNIFNKFIVKKGENFECFTNLIKEIRNDPFPVMNGYRPLRCTGSAISFVSSLLGNLQDVPVKYFIFTQGPCTFGPGTVASVSLSEGIRSYMDIIKGRGAFYTQSVDFYTNLAKEISLLGHSVDILSATLYDVGIYEMKPLVDLTGGIILLAQDFNYEIYLSSCEKITKRRENYLNFTFNNKVKVITSPNLKFKGCLGIGMENQGDWKINCLYEGSNLTLLFDNNNETRSEEIGYIQIITQKQRSDKKIITRVTTLARMFSENKENVLSGFDQEAAMVLQARIFTSKKEPEEEIDLVRRIDRILVKFLRSYASYHQDNPSSLTLPSSMSLFPKFMYFFRRSLLVLLEGISPDEGAYQRNLLLRESTVNSITMIIPTLISYHYQGETGPVEMDATSLNPEVILLFDSFHCVVIWRGNYIAQWLKENLHLQEEYKFLQDLVENVENTGKKLVSGRLLTPKFVICDQFGSQERLLLARVNPSVKGKIVTDDIDYETFKGFLYKLAVSS